VGIAISSRQLCSDEFAVYPLSPHPLGKAALLVIGCGPTGVAGLVQAALEGIPAIGIEAGPAPLASLLAYMEGLVLSSSAEYYEVGGLPLDCCNANRLAREDVLDYYARVITHHRLDIRTATRCIGLEPQGRHVLVHVRASNGLGWYSAGRVLVTSWYERRPLSPKLRPTDQTIAIRSTVQRSIHLAGKRVVILGGGMSAYDYATRLLRAGQPVVLLLRRAPQPIFQEPRFRRLMEATGSAIFHGVSDLELGRSRARFTHEGVRCAVPCDAVVAAIGQRLRENTLQILARAEVLSRRECALLRKARSYERLLYEHPNQDAAGLLRKAAAELPDLGEHLFEGRRGIHLAGGALHVGAANGGLVFSTHSAVLAVRAMAGHSLPAGAEEAPLAEYLPALPLPERLPPALAFERVSALRPLRASISAPHPAMSAALEVPPGRSSHRAAGAIDANLRTAPDVEAILHASDGTLTVASLARRLRVTTAAQRANFLSLLRYLWWNGHLTWLPASEPSGAPSHLA
jgi:thioredoxin reductase